MMPQLCDSKFPSAPSYSACADPQCYNKGAFNPDGRTYSTMAVVVLSGLLAVVTMFSASHIAHIQTNLVASTARPSVVTRTHEVHFHGNGRLPHRLHSALHPEVGDSEGQAPRTISVSRERKGVRISFRHG